MSGWFENDTFWERFAPVMFDEARWAGTSWEVEGVLALSGVVPPARVLDSCCGVGRHSIEFAKRGCTVTGVDRTPSYLSAARDSSSSEHLDIEFIEEDVRTFKRIHHYNLAVNLFTSFGFFSREEEEEAYISNIRESLVDGGVFLIDVNGKELLARDFVDNEVWEKDGSLIYTEYSIEPGWNILNNRWMIVDAEGGKYEYTFSHRIYSAEELRILLKSCGFSEINIYGGFDGKPYDNKADRLIVCAFK